MKVKELIGRICTIGLKRFAMLIAVFSQFSILNSQFLIDLDCMPLSDYGLEGTARYVALGGAMTALGGDATVIATNPAALGLYRRSEVSLTADMDIHTGEVVTWGLPQLSYIYSSGNHNRQKGLIYNNFVLQFVRQKQYHSQPYVEQQPLQFSVTDWMASMASEQQITAFQGFCWDNEQLAWLSCLGYENGLIIPDESGHLYSIRPLQSTVKAGLQKEIYGHSGSVNMAWGTNISNMVYVGVGANIDYWKYSSTTGYGEQTDTLNISIFSYERMSAVGFSGSVGVIYRPIPLVRLGASIVSPSAISLTKHNWVNDSPTNTFTANALLFSSPLRLTAGAALQFGAKGLFSLEYDYLHQVNNLTPDMHWLKAGAEYVVKRHYFLRLGYAIVSPFQTLDWGYRPTNNTVCTILDYTLPVWQQYISAGFGYRTSWLQVETAYQYNLAKAQTFMSIEEQPIDIQTLRHRVVLSLSFTRAK